MAQNAVTRAQPARLRNVDRRAALMLTILVALSACGGGKGNSAGEVPPVCQEARAAFSDWINSSLDMHRASFKMLVESSTINLEMSTNRFTGNTSTKHLKELMTEMNASLKISQQKLVKASELYEVLSPLFKACKAVKGVTLPPACLDEIRQYPTITTAQNKLLKAITALFKSHEADRAAMIAGDKRAKAAADKQQTAAGAQRDAALKSWNDTILPKYEAALAACSKATS